MDCMSCALVTRSTARAVLRDTEHRSAGRTKGSPRCIAPTLVTAYESGACGLAAAQAVWAWSPGCAESASNENGGYSSTSDA